MKMGLRTPSPKKSFSAKTKGKVTRSVKKYTSVGYGKKGMGMLKDPKRSVYNHVYNKTTKGINDIYTNSDIDDDFDDSYSNAPRGKVATVFRYISFIMIFGGIGLFLYSLFSDMNLVYAVLMVFPSVFLVAMGYLIYNLTK